MENVKTKKIVILMFSLLLVVNIFGGCSNKQNLANETNNGNQILEEKNISKIEDKTNKGLTLSLIHI